jgi:sulfur-carrier protein adenylyltransferase/sulfurtransferase
MVWFITEQQRLLDEKQSIEQLAETADWLRGISWGLDGGQLCLDAIIRAHGHDYSVKMIYPALYPHLPPIVQPEDTVRWSSHQYANGVLCLEWGPDNWQPGLDGTHMLTSAYHLFIIENPLGSSEPVAAPSRHYQTIGQEMRGKLGRFYISDVLTNYLASLPAKCRGTVTFSLRFQETSLSALIHSVEPDGFSLVKDASIPVGITPSKQKGICVKAKILPDLLQGIKSATPIHEILEASGCEWTDSDTEPVVLIIDSANQPHLFWLCGKEDTDIIAFAQVKTTAASTARRIPPEFEHIAGKRVGIVGLGSIGSKVALSLARTGVSKFLLVDHDIFMPENTCRHELDWHNVGQHKVDAVKGRISLLAPNVEVDVSRLHLTGQESNAAVNAVLIDLAACDLLIDATASAGVFNLLAAVVCQHKKPLVWARVYAGGIGGMVARHRPGLDPLPRAMRDAYMEAVEQMALPHAGDTEAYTVRINDETVATATDAEVGIIAHHATRLATDILLECRPSLFPRSIYLIGLAQAGSFAEPFDVRPVATDHLLCQEDDGQNGHISTIPEAMDFILEILPKEEAEHEGTAA